MTFVLEAVFAKKGDALILHCGNDDDPHWILVDGGVGVWKDYLKPRLDEIRKQNDLDELPLDMVMVSHIDADHIQGVLMLMQSLARDSEPGFSVETLWHNAFDQISGTSVEEITGILDVAPSDEDGEAASVSQGMELTDYAQQAIKKNRLTSLNGFFRGVKGFPAMVVASRKNSKPFDVGETGIRFTVLAPNETRLKNYQKEWDKQLKAIKKREEAKKKKGKEDAAGSAASLVSMLNPNDAFTFDDKSRYNLASIVVLAESDGATMLLTGDATGADVVEGLVLAGHLPEEALLDAAGMKADENRAKGKKPPVKPVRRIHTFHVDLLKVPHHGSPNNVTTGFFQRVTADHYVISGDGDHGNPHTDMLEMLMKARGDEPYTIHFTLTRKQIDTPAKSIKKQVQLEGLARLRKWLAEYDKQKLTNPRVVFRSDKKKSVIVHPKAAD